MKFISIYRPDPKQAAAPPSKEHMAAMGKLVEEGMKARTLLETGMLQAVPKAGARVRSSGGKIAVVDGPVTASKEPAPGYAILQYKSREEAIQGITDFLKIAGDGECELYQVSEPPPGNPAKP